MVASQKPDRLEIANMIIVMLLLAGLYTVNYVVDPFHANRQFGDIESKRDSVFTLSYWNWKIAEYDHLRTTTIALGDSRMKQLNDDWVTEAAGTEVYDFAYPGGTLADAMESFWFAAERSTLNRVVINVNLNLMNDYLLHRNLCKEAVELYQQPWRYYAHPMTSRASAQVLYDRWQDIDKPRKEPAIEDDTVWKYHLKVTARQAYERFLYPTELLKEVKRMADYCEKKNIELILVMLPTHTDLQQRIDDFGLTEIRERIHADLREIATVYDYDYPCDFTSDRSNFVDPYHLQDEASRPLIQELFGHTKWIAKISTPKQQ